MSYCRWSTDNFKCDLYCYEDVNGGFTTHVASNRPSPPYPYEGSYDEFFKLCLDKKDTSGWSEKHEKWNKEIWKNSTN